MFVVWEAAASSTQNLSQAVENACLCAAALEKFNGSDVGTNGCRSGFPSFSAIFNRRMQKMPLFSCILLRNEGKNPNRLSLHMGLGGGQMMGLTVGGPDRQEYVIAGDCIAQVAAAEGAALDGETILSPEAIASLSESVRAALVGEVHKDGMGVLKQGLEEGVTHRARLDVKSSNRRLLQNALQDRVRTNEAVSALGYFRVLLCYIMLGLTDCSSLSLSPCTSNSSVVGGPPQLDLKGIFLREGFQGSWDCFRMNLQAPLDCLPNCFGGHHNLI